MGLLKFDFNKANAQIQELEEIENAMSVCTYLTEYMNCIEQASRAYTECEQSVAGVVNRIRI